MYIAFQPYSSTDKANELFLKVHKKKKKKKKITYLPTHFQTGG